MTWYRGRRLYRTGDLAYRESSGDYVYVARADRVVKRSGMRISLIEMGELLRQLPGVSAVACVTFDSGDQLGSPRSWSPRLVPTRWTSGGRRRQLMPETHLPDRIELVDELPLTASSKLDERRLLTNAGLTEMKRVAPPGSPTG